MSCLENMLLRSQAAAGTDPTALIHAYEAEKLVQDLRVTPIEEVGDDRFLRQHDAIQKLNLQAHWNAQNHTDEFVLDLLVSLDKLSVLVQELLVIEAWKERLLPLLAAHLAAEVDASTSYLVLYHEAAVANLLEVALYHRHACEAVDEDSLLELADWAARKLAYLNSTGHTHAGAKERSLQDTLALTPAEELADKAAETDFGAATCGLTILRYITVMRRLLCVHDTVMALLPLADSPPWVRTRRDGKLENFIDGKWQPVPQADRVKLTQLDGQVWLALANVLLEPACRAAYEIDDFRKGCILRLQRHLHELLLDQLPMLRQLARALDELSLGVQQSHGPAAAAAAAAAAGGGGGGGGSALSARATAASSRLVIEQVPVLREAIMRGRNWPALAARQRQQQFGPASKLLARERLQSFMQSFELLCQIEEQQQAAQQQQQPGASAAAASTSTTMTGAVGGGGASAMAAGSGVVLRPGGELALEGDAAVLGARVRVVFSRQVHPGGGLWEPWCEISAIPDADKPATDVTIDTSGGCGSSGNGGVLIHGRRFRLAAIDPSSTRALPPQGKVAVHFMGGIAEALLQLPEVPLSRPGAAEAAGVPCLLWVTAGLLAADGFALQLRLRRTDKPSERDRSTGSWCAFQPVGGAITVLSQPAGRAADAAMRPGAVAACAMTTPPLAAANSRRRADITVVSGSKAGASSGMAASDVSLLKP